MPIPTDAPDAWEQQPDEPASEYEAFRTWLEMGPERNMERLAEAMGVTPSVARNLSYKNRWKSRLAAWQTHQTATFNELQRTERRKMAANHARIGSTMLLKCVQRLQQMDDAEVSRMSLHQLTRFMEVALRAQREAYGSLSTLEVNFDGELDVSQRSLTQLLVSDAQASDHVLAALERIALVPSNPQPSALGDSGDGDTQP